MNQAFFSDDGLFGYYIFGEVVESYGFEYPNVSIVITNDSDDQSVVTPSGMSNTAYHSIQRIVPHIISWPTRS